MHNMGLTAVPSMLSTGFAWWSTTWHTNKLDMTILWQTDNRFWWSLLTALNPKSLLLWIAIASPICMISDSIVYTRSNTSGVLTNRTNLEKPTHIGQPWHLMGREISTKNYVSFNKLNAMGYSTPNPSESKIQDAM